MQHHYTLHQSLAWLTPDNALAVESDDDSRYEDESVSKAEALEWIDRPPCEGAVRREHSDIRLTLSTPAVLYSVGTGTERMMVVRWIRQSKED
jgi:hypothetical protein